MKNTKAMRLGAALGCLIAFVGAGSGWAQSISLFEFALAADLTPSQIEDLALIRSLPTTRSVQVVRVNLDALKTAKQIAIPLAADKVVEILVTTREFQGSQIRSLSGQATDMEPGSTTIVANGDAITASIQTRDGLFRLRPLGGKLNAFISVDSKKFPPEHRS